MQAGRSGLAAGLVVIAIATAGCRKTGDGRVEVDTRQAGQKVEHAADQAGHEVKKAAHDVGNALEHEADKVKDEVKDGSR
ncbi:MAG TPA: hypothetical protein VFH27_02850, partial [Longimicrobiaceae bacterium]|nr:hypothetical protein [Longimicrobiaceae bacterium]